MNNAGNRIRKITLSARPLVRQAGKVFDLYLNQKQ
jgi:hypothetical protein